MKEKTHFWKSKRTEKGIAPATPVILFTCTTLILCLLTGKAHALAGWGDWWIDYYANEQSCSAACDHWDSACDVPVVAYDWTPEQICGATADAAYCTDHLTSGCMNCYCRYASGTSCPPGGVVNEYGVCEEPDCEPEGEPPYPPWIYEWDADACEWHFIDCTTENPWHSSDGWYNAGSQKCHRGCKYYEPHGHSDGTSTWHPSNLPCDGTESDEPIDPDECSPGEILLPDGTCQDEDECPEGMEMVNGQCLNSCPPGTQRVGNECLAPCPTGTRREGTQCVPEEECGEGYYEDFYGNCIPTDPFEPWDDGSDGGDGGGDGGGGNDGVEPPPDPDSDPPPVPDQGTCPPGWEYHDGACVPAFGDVDLPTWNQLELPTQELPQFQTKSWQEIYSLYQVAYQDSNIGNALESLTFTDPSGSCPVWTIPNPWAGPPIIIDIQCQIWPALAAYITPIALFLYCFVAIRVFLR